MYSFNSFDENDENSTLSTCEIHGFGVFHVHTPVKKYICAKCWNEEHPPRYHPSMSENKDGAAYLGIYIAERALSGFFDNIQRMPYGNPGYDFICGKGFKIDAKASCLHTVEGVKHPYHYWTFMFFKNPVPEMDDFF